MNITAIVFVGVLSGILSLALSWFLSGEMKRRGIAGIDVHKPNKPLVAEMGGLAVLVAALVSCVLLYLFDVVDSFMFTLALATVLLTGFVGVVDDLFNLKQRYKPFLIVAVTIPLMVALLQRSAIDFPIVGVVSFGLLYPLFIVPLAVTTSANFSNMLAGFNGLEVGNIVIAVGTLTILSAIEGKQSGLLLGVLFLPAYLGLLALNWYPAKIFPGDTGTLMGGAAIATVGLVSGLEFAAVVVSVPAAMDFALKLLSKNPFSGRKLLGDTKVNEDGSLSPAGYPSLVHAFMRVTKSTERSLVDSMLFMEIVYAALATVVTVTLLRGL